MRYFLPWLLIAVCFAAACGGGVSGNVSVDGVKKATDPMALIFDAQDRRSATSDLHDLAVYPDVDIRIGAAMAMGRIGDPDSIPTLVEMTDDPDPRVADAAVFSIGLFGEDAPKSATIALENRLSVHPVSASIGSLLDALARTGSDDVIKVLVPFIDDDRADVRAAAIRAMGLLGQRKIQVEEEVVSAVASHLHDGSQEVRFMAAFALYRIADPSLRPDEVIATLRATVAQDDSAMVRAYALRALASRGGLSEKTLLASATDSDPKVAATAISSLALVEEEKRCRMAAVALASITDAIEKDPQLLAGEWVHVARAALEQTRECSDLEEVVDLARRIGVVADEKIREPRPAGAALVRCLARLVSGRDHLALVSCDPKRPHVGKRMLAMRLGANRETRARDLEILVEMVESPDPRVSVAALESIAGVGTPEATVAVLRAVGSDRALVSAAAMDMIAMHSENFMEGKKANPRVIAAIEKAVASFAPRDEMSAPLISACGAISALRDPAGAGLLEKMALDQRSAVRGVAVAAQKKLGVDTAMVLPPLEPVHPIPADVKSIWSTRKTVVRINTDRGTFRMKLLPDVAPGTVSSFVALAEAGFYDGTEIHRVVPNFVIQAGDSTGTGLGDPGYNIRCEVSPIPYTRGTVGMALSGKDTGGSQFFVTISDQPHLDGNYTVFGRVVYGMEVIDLIEEGDEIISVIVEVRE